MADIVFKNAMFGFDKEDVVKYIEQLQQSHIQNDKLLEERTKALNDALSQVTQLQDKINKMQSQERASASMTQENSQRILDLECENKIIREKAEKYEKDCEKLRIIESQIGAVILDARIYSEKIIEEANNTILNLNRQAAEIINRTATDISISSDELNASSESLSELLSDVNERISELSSDLSGVAYTLDSNVAQYSQEEKTEEENLEDNNTFDKTESESNEDEEVELAEENAEKESESNTITESDSEAEFSKDEDENVTLEVSGFDDNPQNFNLNNDTLFEE